MNVQELKAMSNSLPDTLRIHLSHVCFLDASDKIVSKTKQGITGYVVGQYQVNESELCFCIGERPLELLDIFNKTKNHMSVKEFKEFT